MDFFKGLIPGAILTLVVGGILGVNHSRGGVLSVFHQALHGFSFYWSWQLFIAATLLSWALFAMSPK